jgi:hypothetical protein
VLAIRYIGTVCTQLYRTARGGGNDQEQESFWSQRAASDPTLKRQSKQARHAGKTARRTPDRRVRSASCFQLVPIGRLRAHWKNVKNGVEDTF